jgi:hypothetical protein
VAAFHEKRAPDYAALRATAAAGGRTCPACGERGIPAHHRFCGGCGARLTAIEEGIP